MPIMNHDIYSYEMFGYNLAEEEIKVVYKIDGAEGRALLFNRKENTALVVWDDGMEADWINISALII